ncbi:replication associated protein [Black-headed python circovirus 1]|uniref:Replication-associated protein n=1 Tax=Black-headed python circovirus 1 TaxID=2304615 RepID=A0A4P2U0M7_9CIRC|nr:replication associated protein [Black-headed python circovirus 1]
MANRDHPSKRWCFTINNPTFEDYVSLLENFNEQTVVFFIAGEEVGEKGTPHIQGFVNLVTKSRMEPLRQKLGGRAHLERARGSDAENEKYCSKEGKIYLKIGEAQRQGQRSDLSEAVDLLRSGGTLRDVGMNFGTTLVRYGRGLRDFINVMSLSKPRDFKTDVIVLYGPPGCGKSMFANGYGKSINPEWATYWKPRGKWWDGYNGQEVVVLDDFYGWLPFDEMLRLCDRYPLRVENKGGTVEFISKAIIITSNKEPTQWYNNENGTFNFGALFRRFSKFLVPGGDPTGYEFEERDPRFLAHPINC